MSRASGQNGDYDDYTPDESGECPSAKAIGQPDPRNSRETRTTAFDEQSCRVCRGSIRGRRMNGYCSDRCRMADRRAIALAGRRELVDHLRFVIGVIEKELLGTRSKEEGHDADQ
jgi:hypothetical protein